MSVFVVSVRARAPATPNGRGAALGQSGAPVRGAVIPADTVDVIDAHSVEGSWR